MLQKLKQFINTEHLLSADALYLVALSGGADSVALLLSLKDLGYRVEAVHCNFQLRGEESNRDEGFCQLLCDNEGIALHRVHFDTKTYAELHKVSIEMAARELRYQYFEQLRLALGATAICVGHHKEDSVETILINLIRGTGLSGLQGIRPKRDNIIRPLLCVDRQEIEAYLRKRCTSFVTDSTNLTPDVVRNKVRLEILPQLQQINPAVNDSILATAHHLMGVERIVSSAITALLKESLNLSLPQHNLSFDDLMAEILRVDSFSLNIPPLLHFPDPAYALFAILKPIGFSSSQINEIACHLQGQSGQLWSSPTHQLTHHHNTLFIYRKSAETIKPLRIPEEGKYEYNRQYFIRISSELVNSAQNLTFSTDPFVIEIDADKVQFPLTLRPTEPADRFNPLGMKGSKLVSDFLTDKKLNRIEKRQQLVVADAMGMIVWVVGLRISERVKLTTDTEKKLRMEWINKKK